MSYSDLSKGRFSQTGRAYFITTVTYQRDKIFSDLYCSRDLIAIIRSLHEQSVVESLAWVVMPDHLHWLFVLVDETPLSQVIKILKARSAIKINKRLSRQGSLWQKAFYDRGVRDNESLRPLARYIVANPLRAGLVERIEDYSHWDAIWL